MFILIRNATKSFGHHLAVGCLLGNENNYKEENKGKGTFD